MKRVVPQPTVPSLNASRSERDLTLPPDPRSSFFRNSAAAAPSNHSSGSVPTSRVPLLARDVAVDQGRIAPRRRVEPLDDELLQLG